MSFVKESHFDGLLLVTKKLLSVNGKADGQTLP